MEEFKVKVKNEAESRAVQEAMFKRGYGWNGSRKEVEYETSNYLYFYNDGSISYSTEDNDGYFNGNSKKEMLVKDILKGKLPKQIPEELHVTLIDNCKNFNRLSKNYKEAIDNIGDCSESKTIYKLVPVAKVEKTIKVTKIKTKINRDKK